MIPVDLLICVNNSSRSNGSVVADLVKINGDHAITFYHQVGGFMNAHIANDSRLNQLIMVPRSRVGTREGRNPCL